MSTVDSYPSQPSDIQPRRSSLRESIASLYLVQFAAYAVPLVTLPWLSRALGPDAFGRLGFCVAVCGYFGLFADYGFNLSATRRIAQQAGDKRAVSIVFISTLAAKAALALTGFVVLLLLSTIGRKFGADRNLLVIGYCSVLGGVLTPTWYFHGTERQSVLSFITLCVRLLSVPATVLLVHESQDLYIAVLIAGVAPLLTGCICLIVVARSGVVQWVRISVRDMLDALRDGWHLFLSTASMSLYTSFNVVLLGVVAGNSAVAHYTAAEKLCQVAQSFLTPLNQALYPRMSRLMDSARNDAFSLARRMLRVQGSIALILSIFLYLLAPWLIHVLYGIAFSESVDVLRVLAAIPFVVGVSNVLGLQAMLPLGMKSMFSRIVVGAGTFNVVVLYLLAGRFAAHGAAVSVLTTEILVLLAMAVVLYRFGSPIFIKKAQ